MSIKVFFSLFFLFALLVGSGQVALMLEPAQDDEETFFCIDPAVYVNDLWRKSLDFFIEGRAERRRVLQTLADQAAAKNNVDPALFRSLVKHESGWEPDALSPRGAVGLAQVMPTTASSECGLNMRQLSNPQDNLDCGAKYLAKQIKRFGSVKIALCAYNAGPSITAKLGRCPDYRETRRYVRRVMNSWKTAS